MIMKENEMLNFIKAIGRDELFVEMKEIEESRGHKVIDGTSYGGMYPRYLKAVRVSLIALGYDQDWVEDEFRTALENYYFNKNEYFRECLPKN